ncbi:MAG: cytochrome d ubiquinol oxidase subunit II, partial [Chloroflexi bacterium]|nr:cytochrome d ubiquinol oxidase subunit II [Chloroflexota bacterium]
MLAKSGVMAGIIPLIGIIALLLSSYFLSKKKEGWAFVMVAGSIALFLLNIFVTLYPRVMVSILNDSWSLTIQNAASTPYTLKIMSIVAIIFVPIVLVYQGWTYWVFRKRVEHKEENLTY